MDLPLIDDRIINWTEILLNSFSEFLGYELIPKSKNKKELANKLFNAPFVVVSHGTQSDPILNYGNKIALELWETNWEKFIKTPSRLTAEAIDREERKIMLEQAARQNYIDNYSGIRISSTGKKFSIDRAIVWNLVDSQGNKCGQAATFAHWKFIN